jgi:hypothetical protein
LPNSFELSWTIMLQVDIHQDDICSVNHTKNLMGKAPPQLQQNYPKK